MEVLLALLIGIPLIFVLVSLSVVINGFVLKYLWIWFIVPVFHLPELTLAQAFGVAMVISYATYQHIREAKSEDPDWSAFHILVSRPATTLLAGWILQHFV